MNKKSNSNISYYDILQVGPQSSDCDIKAAYYKLAKRFHPDKNPQERRLAELRFRLINEAYDRLKTKDQRMIYNKSLRSQKRTIKTMKKNVGNDNRSETKGWSAIIGTIFGLNKNQNSKQA